MPPSPAQRVPPSLTTGSPSPSGPSLLGARGGLLRGGGRGLVRRVLGLEQRDARFHERPADVVADPLAVPPFDRRDRDPLDQDLVVQVIADGQAGGARATEL